MSVDLCAALLLMFKSYKSFTWKMYIKFWHEQFSSYRVTNTYIDELLNMEADFRDMKIVEDLIQTYTPSPVTFYDKHKKQIEEFKEKYGDNFMAELENIYGVGNVDMGRVAKDEFDLDLWVYPIQIFRWEYCHELPYKKSEKEWYLHSLHDLPDSLPQLRKIFELINISEHDFVN